MNTAVRAGPEKLKKIIVNEQTTHETGEPG
jgi:hypothetical protein